MSWLPKVCGSYREAGPASRALQCLTCRDPEPTDRIVRRGDTLSEDECDICGVVLASTVDAKTVHV